MRGTILRLNQSCTRWILLGVIFAPSFSLAKSGSAGLCSIHHLEALVQPPEWYVHHYPKFLPEVVKPFTDPFQIKQSHRLSKISQALRRILLSMGVIDTTRQRSEYKHYITTAQADRIMADLIQRFPPIFDIHGMQISGISSRDFRVTAGKRMEILLGPQITKALKDRRLLSAFKYQDVFVQHEAALTEALAEIVGDRGQALVLLEKVKSLHTLVLQDFQNRDYANYTDTTSTAKFSYWEKPSRKAIEELADKLEIDLSDSQIDFLMTQNFFEMTGPVREAITKNFRQQGLKKETAKKLIEAMVQISTDEGVIRYRKYLIGPKGTDFLDVPEPGSPYGRVNKNIKDADFAEDIVWVENKMKSRQGEESLATKVDKPRFPFSEHHLEIIWDPARFVDPKAFEATKELLLNEVEANVKRLQSIGVKEAKFNREELLADLNFYQSLHLEGLDLRPVGRTVYRRHSFNFNFVDAEGRIINVQITRDKDVMELDRNTGKIVQALPWVDMARNWHFQFNAVTGRFEHRDPSTSEVLHVFAVGRPDAVFEIKDGQYKLVKADLSQVEVVELKAPIPLIQLPLELRNSTLETAAVFETRDLMLKRMEKLNKLRSKVGLPLLEKDKGKRATSRDDSAGGLTLLLHPKGDSKWIHDSKLVQHQFHFHPETGYWVDWKSDARYIFHPNIGVFEITHGLNDAEPIATKNVYYRP